MSACLWEPSAARIEASNLTRFRVEANARHGLAMADYDDLYDWSLRRPAEFWSLVWDFCGVIADAPAATVLAKGAHLTEARFFPGARVNFAENLLRRRDDAPALIFHGEDVVRRELTWRELYDTVSRLARVLKARGVAEGDRVAGYMPNMPETIIAMLATASLGAVWSSCSPDFGAAGVLDRFGQIGPKVLFTADGYYYGGKAFSSLATVARLAAEIDTIEAVVVVPYRDPAPDISALGGKAMLLADAIADQPAGEIEYHPVDFSAPLYIMYSSGTTGLPKCIVHGVGGTLIQHLKEHQLLCDVKDGDRLFYFTSCGWMMWNWLASGLASGATLVLYDGSPFHPDGNRLADVIDAEGVTIFGTSAKYIDACAKAGIKPAASHDLSTLRTILSTGSPLAPASYDYIYQDWKTDLCLSSIAGGTDILGCFMGGNPIGPVYRGEIQKRCLGLDVQVFDEAGNALVGEPGELVCTNAHPSMPIRFWNDPEGRRYHDAYFADYPNVWRHGDWVALTERGGIVVEGRSDATLNPGGVRIGTAEIYRQVEGIDEVVEALVVGQTWRDDMRIVLFVCLRDGISLDDALVDRIRRDIRANASPRHVPAVIVQVSDIPRTKSGKIVELAVREIIHGRPVKNVEALANPDALAAFKDRPELQV